VLMEFERFGVRQTWVVECKRRQSRVEKAHVLTLQGVVGDIGADRGFLLSESDFQSGAIAAARFSNITLSNLADLRGNAAADLNEHRWNVLLGRHAALWEWNQAPAGRSRGAPSLWKSLGADSRISFM
jgi:restriction system protein